MVVLDEVLREVNKIRDRNGLLALAELPQGRRWQAGECVLARAFEGVFPNVRVGSAHVYSATVHRRLECWRGGFDLNSVLEIFIENFDDGLYPELVEEAVEPVRKMYEEAYATARKAYAESLEVRSAD